MGKKGKNSVLLQMRSFVIDRICEEMEKKGWNKSRLAKECKISESSIGRKLSKDPKKLRGLNLEDLEMITKALDISPGDLFPKKFLDDFYHNLQSMPFTELMGIICRKEIEKYFSEQK